MTSPLKRFVALLLLAFVVGFVFAPVTHGANCGGPITLGQEYWIFGPQYSPGDVVPLGSFPTNAEGHTITASVVHTTDNAKSIRSGTNVQVGPALAVDVESSSPKTTPASPSFVAGATVDISVILGSDPRASIEVVNIECLPNPTTTTLPVTTSTSTEPPVTSTSAPTTTAPPSTAITSTTSSSMPTSSTSTTSSVPGTTSTTTSSSDPTTTEAGPSTTPTSTTVPSSTTRAPAPSGPPPTPMLPPTGRGRTAGQVLIAVGLVGLGWALIATTRRKENRHHE